MKLTVESLLISLSLDWAKQSPRFSYRVRVLQTGTRFATYHAPVIETET